MLKRIYDNLKDNWITYGFETLVVVVGILVAFGLNNWNENRKDRIREVEILTEIRENLTQDFEDHKENMGYLSHVVKSSNIILNHLNSDLPYHDSLAYHFAWLPMAANFDPINSGYDLWMSEGASIISNDSIRLKLSKLYAKDYKWLRDFLKDRQYNDNYPLKLDMMKKFKEFKLLSRAVPRDFEVLRNDEDFKVLVDANSHIIGLTLRFYSEIVSFSENLILELKVEIDRLEND